MFGGVDNKYKILDTIEQYDITDRQTWVIINLKLKKSLDNLASITISPTEILVFGGKDDNGW